MSLGSPAYGTTNATAAGRNVQRPKMKSSFPFLLLRMKSEEAQGSLQAFNMWDESTEEKRVRMSMGSYNTGERTLKPKSLSAVTILEREHPDLGNTPL